MQIMSFETRVHVIIIENHCNFLVEPQVLHIPNRFTMKTTEINVRKLMSI